MQKPGENGFTLLEMVFALAITSALISTFLLVLTSANDSLHQTLVNAYVRETGQSALEVIASDVRGLARERTCLPARSEDFDRAGFPAGDPSDDAARYLSLIVLKREYIDAEGNGRSADILFLQTTGAGDAEGGRKVNPVCRVLYALCAADGDGDRSNDPAVTLLSREEIANAKSINLHRCVWYSRSAFARLELPDGVSEMLPPEESLLAQEVVAFEVRVMTADAEEFSRRTFVFPNVEDKTPVAIEFIITLRDPHTREEHEVRAAFALEELECY